MATEDVRDLVMLCQSRSDPAPGPSARAVAARKEESGAHTFAFTFEELRWRLWLVTGQDLNWVYTNEEEWLSRTAELGSWDLGRLEARHNGVSYQVDPGRGRLPDVRVYLAGKDALEAAAIVRDVITAVEGRRDWETGDGNHLSLVARTWTQGGTSMDTRSARWHTLFLPDIQWLRILGVPKE